MTKIKLHPTHKLYTSIFSNDDEPFLITGLCDVEGNRSDDPKLIEYMQLRLERSIKDEIRYNGGIKSLSIPRLDGNGVYASNSGRLGKLLGEESLRHLPRKQGEALAKSLNTALDNLRDIDSLNLDYRRYQHRSLDDDRRKAHAMIDVLTPSDLIAAVKMLEGLCE